MTGIPIKDAITAAAKGDPMPTATEGMMKVKEQLDRMGLFANPMRFAVFLGQTAHESLGFSVTSENLNYSAKRLMQVWPTRFRTSRVAWLYAYRPEKLANKVYGKRMGNNLPGDGWLYRGRGYLQLTGRDNYVDASVDLDIDIAAEPDRAEEPAVAWLVAAQYFASRSYRGKTAFEWADRGDDEAVTRIVNGGLHGLADRALRTQRALNVLEAGWPK